MRHLKLDLMFTGQNRAELQAALLLTLCDLDVTGYPLLHERLHAGARGSAEVGKRGLAAGTPENSACFTCFSWMLVA